MSWRSRVGMQWFCQSAGLHSGPRPPLCVRESLLALKILLTPNNSNLQITRRRSLGYPGLDYLSTRNAVGVGVVCFVVAGGKALL